MFNWFPGPWWGNVHSERNTDGGDAGSSGPSDRDVPTTAPSLDVVELVAVAESGGGILVGRSVHGTVCGQGGGSAAGVGAGAGPSAAHPAAQLCKRPRTVSSDSESGTDDSDVEHVATQLPARRFPKLDGTGVPHLSLPEVTDSVFLGRLRWAAEKELHCDSELLVKMKTWAAKFRFRGAVVDADAMRVWVAGLYLGPDPVPVVVRLGVPSSSVWPGPVARRLAEMAPTAPLVVATLEAVFGCPSVVRQWDPEAGPAVAHLAVGWSRLQTGPGASVCVSDCLPFAQCSALRTPSGVLLALDAQVVCEQGPGQDRAGFYLVTVVLAGATDAQAAAVKDAWVAAVTQLRENVHLPPLVATAVTDIDKITARGVAAATATARLLDGGCWEIGRGRRAGCDPGVEVCPPTGPGVSHFTLSLVVPRAATGACVSVATLHACVDALGLRSAKDWVCWIGPNSHGCVGVTFHMQMHV